jgi:uncharacterized protein YkwD
MKRSWLLVISLAACSNTGGPGGTDSDDDHRTDGPSADVPGGGSDEPADLAGITLLHNQARAAVQTSTPLPSLAWDSTLAQIAATWAAMCKDVEAPAGLVDHDPDRTTGSGYAYVGENIFGSGGTATAAAAMHSWMSEEADYNYAANSCSGVCGHYTQIVWRDTTHLGCALYDCAGLTYGSTIVCDYGPGGNVNGERPY